MYFRERQLRVTHVRARHAMVEQVRSILAMERHILIMYVRVMHGM
jgi:hypothetical protein